MTDWTLAQCAAGEGGPLPYWDAGSGVPIVAIADGEGVPTRAHTLLAERRRVIVFAMMTAGATPAEAARRIAAGLATLGFDRCDLLGEGAGAATALWLALAPRMEVGAVLLAAPDGAPDAVFGKMTRPALVLSGTRDRSESGDRYRRLLPDCHFMLVYDADRAIGAERPEALASIAHEFFERHGLFLVSQENAKVFP
jgi:pimeloyl-ACP methyl ester carboxylesterase